ncbi:hypothetical protein [Polaromonas sp.]|uniref:hypothetical protein n=1 Tax=Polaromonas sp. TaxID=1869339 RepID=UPI002730F518|nr:hypothetical protein [Polaromonas sp.]MDP1886610.1 hypothetical protein [Polaromonas sp.]
MTRPYGKPLIAVLEALATSQPATGAQIRERLPLALQAKTSHACYWAVKYELMNEDCTGRPRKYSLAPGWQARVDARQAEAARPAPQPYTVKPAPPPAEQLSAATVATALANRHPLEEAWAGFR